MDYGRGAPSNWCEKSVRFVPALAVLLTGCLYFASAPANHSEAEDAMKYMYQFSAGGVYDQFHPHHLLSNAFFHVLYHGWNRFAAPVTPETLAVSVNVVFAMACLWLMARIGLAMGLGTAPAAAALLFTAFSYGFWRYSVECEVYIVPLAILLSATLLLFELPRRAESAGFHAGLGLLHAAAVLFHQQHVLFAVPVAAVYLWCARSPSRAFPLRAFLGGFAVYAAAGAFVTLLVYGIVIVTVLPSLSAEELRNWIFHYMVLDHGGWGHWEASNVFKGIMGFAKTIAGMHFVFGSETALGFLKRILGGQEFLDDTFLARNLSGAWIAALSAGAAVFGISTAVLGVLALSGRRLWTAGVRANPRRQSFLVFSAALVAVYSAFNLWWEPKNVEFWISLVPYIALSAAIALCPPAGGPKAGPAAAAALASLLFINGFGAVGMQRTVESDYWYMFNRYFIENAREGDLIVTKHSAYYIEYHTGLPVIDAAEIKVKREYFPAAIMEAVRKHRPARILVSSTVREIPEYEPVFLRLTGDATVIHRDQYHTVHEAPGFRSSAGTIADHSRESSLSG